MQWFEKFIHKLVELLKESPYKIFIFSGAVFLIISLLISQKSFEQIWIFFIYSVGGSIWRYIEKDINSGISKLKEDEKRKNIWHLVIIIIYHIGNILLFYALFRYLNIKMIVDSGMR